MSLQDKYRSVLELGKALNVSDGDIQEVDGVLKIRGTAATQYDKDQLWDAIKATGGEQPSDIVADINVKTTEYYAMHTVKSGESLSKIAKHYYNNANSYMKIFDANKSILKDPNMIHPGQELTIPNV